MNANKQTDRQVKAEKKKGVFLDRTDFYIFHTPLLRMSTTFLAFK